MCQVRERNWILECREFPIVDTMFTGQPIHHFTVRTVIEHRTNDAFDDGRQPGLVLVAAAYFGGIRVVYFDQRASAIEAASSAESPEPPRSLRNAVIGFAVAAAVICVTGAVHGPCSRAACRRDRPGQNIRRYDAGCSQHVIARIGLVAGRGQDEGI